MFVTRKKLREELSAVQNQLAASAATAVSVVYGDDPDEFTTKVQQQSEAAARNAAELTERVESDLAQAQADYQRKLAEAEVARTDAFNATVPTANQAQAQQVRHEQLVRLQGALRG